MWVIETASLKHGYNRNQLVKLEEVHSDLHIIINIWVNSKSSIQFWLIETTPCKFGYS